MTTPDSLVLIDDDDTEQTRLEIVRFPRDGGSLLVIIRAGDLNLYHSVKAEDVPKLAAFITNHPSAT